MKKGTPPDTLAVRDALTAGCSLWKPILVPVSHAEAGAWLGGEHGNRPASWTDETGEDGAMPGDTNRD